jgi:ATP-dependent Clp protease adaptor protein ClpS
MVKEKTIPVTEKLSEHDTGQELILFNDEVNTFEFVIETLVEVCEHDYIQAEQCTFIAHFKGKCAVKSGTFSELKPLSEEMSRRGLTVSIE